jgi:hypothetical protein
MGATVAAAQQKSPIGKDSWLVGGSAGLSRTSTDGGPGTTNASLAPFGLYFFVPHLAVGGTVDLGYQWSKLQGADAHDATVGVEPTIRYFFGDPAGKLFPYLNASIGPSWERFSSDAATPADQTTHGLAYTGSAGLMQMLSSHVGLTGELYYSKFKRTAHVAGIEFKQNSSNYGLRFGFNAFVF